VSSVRRIYTREFKVEAAKLSYNSEKPVEEITESLGVSQSSLDRWRREYRQDPDQPFRVRGTGGRGCALEERAETGADRE
jgi:transposase-like protein